MDAHTDGSILKHPPARWPLSIVQSDEKTVAQDNNFSLQLHHDPLAFTLFKDDKIIQQSATDGHFDRRYRLPPFVRIKEGWLINLELSYNESVYGLGEKWSRLDKRGHLVRSYNHDALGVNSEKSYKNTPYVWSLKGWQVFTHTSSPVTHSLGYAPWSQRAYGLLIEDSIIDTFIYHASQPAQGLHTYCELTGFAPVPPDWSFGAILSKAYYKDAIELLSTAKKVRDKSMPCDVITLDGRAWQDTETRFAFEWDSSRYPNPKAVINELKELGFKVCIWEYPLVSVKHPLFEQASEKGWLLKDRRTGKAYRYEWDQSPFNEVLTPLPESGIWDFTHPDAYQFWRDAHKDLFDLGVDMIKADFGEQVEDDNIVAYNGESGHQLHNIYSLLYNRCVYEAACKYGKNGAFLFSRSAWTGSQCYPSQWGGDPQADWEGFAASIRGALSWGMSGGPFYASDIGGFYQDTRDDILYVRWAQASVFSAHFRLHGVGSREPWSYSADAEKAVMKALDLRYQLLPYLKTAALVSSNTGLPVQRAMPLAFPEDVLSHSFEHQFMCGEDLLVIPCLNPSGEVSFYLPKGSWISFPDKKPYKGGCVYSEALTLEQILVFAPEGTRLPLSEPSEYIIDAIKQTNEWFASSNEHAT